MFSLHPMLVHFPLALLSTGFLFDLTGFIFRRSDLQRVGWWMMLSGVVGLALGITTGLIAEADVAIPAGAQPVLDSHKELAFLMAIVFSTLFLWRLAGKSALPTRLKWLFWGLYGAGVCLLWVVAWYGGTMVYEYGVSVNPP